MPPSASSRRAALAAASSALVLLALPQGARADVVPFADCVRPGSPTYVYFGYRNDGQETFIGSGETNRVDPGLEFQGQPEVFNPGTYGRVFRAVWNQEHFASISWVLGAHVAATVKTGPGATPPCVAGATGPASGVTPTSAVLHAAVGTVGEETAFHFEYGTGAAPDVVLPGRTAAAGARRTVDESLTGLLPATTYRYRVVATDADGTTTGEERTFTTPALPAPAPERIVVVDRPVAAALTPSLDVTAPALRGVEVVPARLRGGTAALTRAAIREGRVLFALSEDAQVVLTAERRAGGRRAGSRCVAPAPSRRAARPCTRLIRIARVTVAGTAGGNAVRLDRLLRSAARLTPGRYRLGVQATDAAGRRSPTAAAAFTVLPRSR